MRFEKGFVTAAVNGDAKKALILAPIMKRCASIACAKHGRQEYADDVAQELWMFLAKNHRRINEAFNVEPFFLRVCNYIFLALHRRYGMHGTGSLPGESGDFMSDEALDSALLADNDNEIYEMEEGFSESAYDAERAINKLMSKSPALRVGIFHEAQKSMLATPSGAKHDTSSRDVSLSSDQQEIKRLRCTAGMTQRKMAMTLGIRLCTYQSYEYGRTKGVPASIMEQARSLASTHNADPRYSADDLKVLRETAGMSQRKMAAALQLKTTTYQAYEHGRTKGVPPHVMEQAGAIASAIASTTAAPDHWALTLEPPLPRKPRRPAGGKKRGHSANASICCD